MQKNKKIWDVVPLNIDYKFNEKFITFDSSGKKLVSISDSLPNNVRLWQLIDSKNGIRVQFMNTLTNYDSQTPIDKLFLNPQENLIAMCVGNSVTFKNVSLGVDETLFQKSLLKKLYTKKMPTLGDLKISFFDF